MAAEIEVSGENKLRASVKLLDSSPDSVIFIPDRSNFSLPSSSSASGGRCSFSSDAQDSPVFEISQHLAGHVQDDDATRPVPNSKPTVTVATHTNRFFTTARKAYDNRVNASIQAVTSDDVRPLDSARNSSVSLKECDDKRSTVSSPRDSLGGVMRKTAAAAATARRSVGFPSPVTPNYSLTGGGGIQKGWSSERVPVAGAVGGRRHAAALATLSNGRPLPSKWEDAERWIFSPAFGDGGGVRPTLLPPIKRPKSKSGPLAPPGAAYNSSCSPAIPVSDGVHFTVAPSGSRGGRVDFPVRALPCIARSASLHVFTDILSSGHSSSLPSSRDEKTTDEKLDDVNDAADIISHAVSRRDVATQMSPKSSTHTSPKRRLSYSPSISSALPIEERAHSSRTDVRDVQVDERVTLTRWSKKSWGQMPRKKSRNVDASKNKASDFQSPAWNLSETTKSISRVKREEANITAWENLQKAKAEAAIRTLEVKLEKKRTSSMDKILHKLKSAQNRAQKMRSSLASQATNEVGRTSHKALLFRRGLHMDSLSGCFIGHAY